MEDEIIVEWMGEMGLMDSQAAVERLGFLPLHRQARILLLGFFHDMGAPWIFYILYVFYVLCKF